jgi:hypothetical protein
MLIATSVVARHGHLCIWGEMATAATDNRMSPNVPAKSLTAREEQAAGVVARDEQTDDEIAASIGVKRRTLTRWRKRPDFAARVATLVEEAREAARAKTIANKQHRVARLQERSEKLDRVLAARAEQHAGVPGGDTGLLVREPKIVKVYEVKNWRGNDAGDDPDGDDDEQLQPTGRVVVMHEYKVDTGTLAELRQIEKQAAQEVGEWVEKVAPTKGDGSDLDLATLCRRRARCARRGPRWRRGRTPTAICSPWPTRSRRRRRSSCARSWARTPGRCPSGSWPRSPNRAPASR